MKFQGIVLRIIVKILMSGPPTGELQGGVWRRPQGAVKRRRRQSLHTSKSPRKSSKRFLEISCFFNVFTNFRGPKLLHGIPFFLPDSSALKTPTQLNALAHIKEALPPEIYTRPQILPRTPYNAKKCHPATEAPRGRFDFWPLHTPRLYKVIYVPNGVWQRKNSNPRQTSRGTQSLMRDAIKMLIRSFWARGIDATRRGVHLKNWFFAIFFENLWTKKWHPGGASDQNLR